ncbi:MAG: Dam family site-specific DNA-(adenine-N6)-methyltransferase [Ignavibacteriales bacterium]|nr:Dam family site-specific DNA-(adenine-N6)-methyltransferase [Ignavibacteriales bacterium]
MNYSFKPPLKWAGGKRWLAPTIKMYWNSYPDHETCRLVEPLCGGLAIALHIQPNYALLNDINQHLINFYIQIKEGLKIDSEMINQSDFFYKRREEFNTLIKNNEYLSKRAAELFYYLNRTCFNGLCRFNKQGFFNTPFGKYKSINYKTVFFEYKEVFKNWTFTCQKFDETDLLRTDFIYADPPYDVEFRQYSKDGFSWENQVELATWLSKHKGPVLLSNQATKRILSLYEDKGFTNTIHMGPRYISADKNKRIPVKEVLAVKNIDIIEHSLAQASLFP